MGKSLSSAARKAWATRKKKYGKGGSKKSEKSRVKPKHGICYTVESGKVISHTEPFRPGKASTIYYSGWEAEQVAKHGPKWFLKKKR